MLAARDEAPECPRRDARFASYVNSDRTIRNSAQLTLQRPPIARFVAILKAMSMITVYLRAYRPQNFRNKQSFRDHAASRDNRWNSRHIAPKGTAHYALKLTALRATRALT